MYFDTAYIAKCYLNEPGGERVRQLAASAPGLASCEVARLEFACVLRRHVREGQLTRRQAREVWADFREDEEADVWRWLPADATLIGKTCDRVNRLGGSTFLRAADALHLGCAVEHGFTEVYTSDRHMLRTARFFGLAGVDVLEPG
jgi:predicted nucleic acid-binding protein